jgi:hypothetical protein
VVFAQEIEDFLGFGRITSLRNAGSTPGPTRTIASPISISIVTALGPTRLSAMIGTKSDPKTPASAVTAARNSRRQP